MAWSTAGPASTIKITARGGVMAAAMAARLSWPVAWVASGPAPWRNSGTLAAVRFATWSGKPRSRMLSARAAPIVPRP
jgi:hypothetical protein